MPWPGDPRVNIQDENGKEVRQVLAALAKLSEPKDPATVRNAGKAKK
jgi:hypothetical protein